MKKFKQKEYTIQEGHYTGPKDLEKVPGAFEVVGKATLGGSAIGGVLGGVLDKAGVEGASISEGISTGGKTGFLAGIVAKSLLNALHNPMKTVKFQEVDKLLRAKFGIYRVSGFTAGDTLQKRKTVEEKFSYNDRNVTNYKISFCIQNNKVTMYTLCITDEDLEKLNGSLDYYCKKFTGMEYTAKPINPKENSYSVTITFTNYKAVSDFIAEISEILGYKINLLNDNALIERETSEKYFSFGGLDKYDLFRMLGNAGRSAVSVAVEGPRMAWSMFVAQMISDAIHNVTVKEAAKYFPANAKNLGNSWLIDRLTRLKFINGVHYTEDMKNCECNMRLDQGIFVVTVLANSKSDLLLKKILPADKKKEVRGKVNLWTLPVKDRGEFDKLLNSMIASGVKPNIM